MGRIVGVGVARVITREAGTTSFQLSLIFQAKTPLSSVPFRIASGRTHAIGISDSWIGTPFFAGNRAGIHDKEVRCPPPP